MLSRLLLIAPVNTRLRKRLRSIIGYVRRDCRRMKAVPAARPTPAATSIRSVRPWAANSLSAITNGSMAASDSPIDRRSMGPGWGSRDSGNRADQAAKNTAITGRSMKNTDPQHTAARDRAQRGPAGEHGTPHGNGEAPLAPVHENVADQRQRRRHQRCSKEPE